MSTSMWLGVISILLSLSFSIYSKYKELYTSFLMIKIKKLDTNCIDKSFFLSFIVIMTKSIVAIMLSIHILGIRLLIFEYSLVIIMSLLFFGVFLQGVIGFINEEVDRISYDYLVESVVTCIFLIIFALFLTLEFKTVGLERISYIQGESIGGLPRWNLFLYPHIFILFSIVYTTNFIKNARNLYQRYLFNIIDVLDSYIYITISIILFCGGLGGLVGFDKFLSGLYLDSALLILEVIKICVLFYLFKSLLRLLAHLGISRSNNLKNLLSTAMAVLIILHFFVVRGVF